MSTYRKFDKYRQRADFAVDINYGIDTTANQWINTGTGTPVYTPAGADGFTFGTSSGGTATSFIQRGTVSGATAVAPVTLRKGRKAHVVADIVVEGDGITATDTLGFSIGFFEVNANPVAQDGIGFTVGYDVDGKLQITSKAGADTDVHVLDGVLADFVHEGHLALEVYYDGTDVVQFFMGRRRVAKAVLADAADAENGDALIADPLSPTLGIANNGGSTNSVRVSFLGWAAQRAPFFGNF